MSVHHVVHVINSLGVSGGAEQQLVNNLNHFADAGLRHSVVVLFADDYGSRAADHAAHTDAGSPPAGGRTSSPLSGLRTARRWSGSVMGYP